jgi:hypothetical protein
LAKKIKFSTSIHLPFTEVFLFQQKSPIEQACEANWQTSVKDTCNVSPVRQVFPSCSPAAPGYPPVQGSAGILRVLLQVDLRKANLKDATDITVEELEKQAKSLQGATMPGGEIHS